MHGSGRVSTLYYLLSNPPSGNGYHIWWFYYVCGHWKLIPCSGMVSDAKWSTRMVDKWGRLVNHIRVSINVICGDVSKHSLMFHPAAHVVHT